MANKATDATENTKADKDDVANKPAMLRRPRPMKLMKPRPMKLTPRPMKPLRPL